MDGNEELCDSRISRGDRQLDLCYDMYKTRPKLDSQQVFTVPITCDEILEMYNQQGVMLCKKSKEALKLVAYSDAD